MQEVPPKDMWKSFQPPSLPDPPPKPVYAVKSHVNGSTITLKRIVGEEWTAKMIVESLRTFTESIYPWAKGEVPLSHAVSVWYEKE
jgi:hypothetical protein